MNYMRRFIAIQYIFFVLCCYSTSKAQEATTATGGNASSSTGNVSFSVGQIDFISFNNTTNAGIQQSFDNSISLPITGLKINAIKQGKDVLVKWETVTESNTSHFIVQRSTAINTTADSIGNIIAKENSTVLSNYLWVDKYPSKGINYYRLKQVDKDGKSALSTVILVRYETGKEPILVYPNPVREKLVLELTNDMQGQIVVKIIDLKGNILYSQFKKITSRQLNINVSALPAGVYFIETTINQKVQSNKFVKE